MGVVPRTSLNLASRNPLVRRLAREITLPRIGSPWRLFEAAKTGAG